MERVNRILDKMSNVSKPQRKFLLSLFVTIIVCNGKMNFRNLSRYSDYTEKSYSRWFRKEFNFTDLNSQAIIEAIPPLTEPIAIMDCTFVSKSGKKTYGLDRFYNSKHNRSEKGLEVSLLAVADPNYPCAYALSARQTPKVQVTENKETTRIDHYLQHLKEDRLYLPSSTRYLAVDGYYAKAKFVNGVIGLSLNVISKLRRDANLRHLYRGEQKKRGRPKLFASKVNFSQLENFQYLGEIEPNFHLYTAIVYSIAFKREIRLLVVLDWQNIKRPGTALLFSTDTQLSGEWIYKYYRTRFQIEFIFRDAKQFTGLNDCQATNQQALNFHFNASFAALNQIKIEDQINGKMKESKVFSMSSWKTRYYNGHLLSQFILKLDLCPDFVKNHPAYWELRNYGSIAA